MNARCEWWEFFAVRRTCRGAQMRSHTSTIVNRLPSKCGMMHMWRNLSDSPGTVPHSLYCTRRWTCEVWTEGLSSRRTSRAEVTREGTPGKKFVRHNIIVVVKQTKEPPGGTYGRTGQNTQTDELLS